MIKLTSITFDDFLRKSDLIHCIDLSDVAFISPAILTQLCGWFYALHNDRVKNLTVKLNDTIGPYLARAGFIDCIKPIVKIEPEAYGQSDHSRQRYGSNPLLIEVTKIDDIDSLQSLLDRIVHVLRTRLHYSKVEAFDTVTALSEVCQNTFDHNKKGIGLFIAMQVYTVRNKSFLEIGIADYGEGLGSTLFNNQKLDLWERAKRGGTFSAEAYHLEAIRLAVQLGVSQYDDPTRGTGLYHLLNIVRKNAGTAQIHTGWAKVRYKVDKTIELTRNVAYLFGVNIVLTLNAKAA